VSRFQQDDFESCVLETRLQRIGLEAGRSGASRQTQATERKN
jgi:hypothetical protein